MTNFDKLKEEIKNMTPEEFVGLYDNFCDRIPDEICDKYIHCCDDCVLHYLKSEVEE